IWLKTRYLASQSSTTRLRHSQAKWSGFDVICSVCGVQAVPSQLPPAIARAPIRSQLARLSTGCPGRRRLVTTSLPAVTFAMRALTRQLAVPNCKQLHRLYSSKRWLLTLVGLTATTARHLLAIGLTSALMATRCF
ncbi:hypothetical protein LPJ71_012182, partial [Coemansia sp. S17]